MKSPAPSLPLDVAHQFSEKGLPKNFCIVPFKNLIFNPSGKISVCRTKGTDHIIGSLENNTVNELWNNEQIVSWRKEFLSGKITTCSKEIAREHCNLMPENYLIWPEISLDGIQNNNPLKFTANFNGQCNLRCIMCNVWSMQNGYYDQINFWEKAETDFFPFIKEVELLSGEPFIQKDTYRLIDKIAAVNPDCIWSFTTNAHWKFNDKIRSYLDKIKIQNIIVSIDSLNPTRYAEIRKGGDLNFALETLESIIEYRNNSQNHDMEITFHFVAMIQNWKEIYEVYNFAKSKKLKLIINNLIIPKEFSLDSLNDVEKLAIIDHNILIGDKTFLRSMGQFFSSILQTMSPIAKGQALQKFKTIFLNKTLLHFLFLN
jgi:cyclic pyranopterin phosphate synthase